MFPIITLLTGPSANIEDMDLAIEGFSATHKTLISYCKMNIFDEARDENALKLNLLSVSCPITDQKSILKQFKLTPLSSEKFKAQKTLYFLFCNDMLVLGCECHESMSFSLSHTPELLTVYVSKIDTTGLMKPRNMQRPTVYSFIKRLYRYYFGFCKDNNISLRLYVYARSSPEYMFPGSKYLKSKGFITERHLVYWWKNVLEYATEGLGSYVDKFWIIPGLPKEELPQAHRSDQWKYTYPDFEQQAQLCLPHFEDDSKSNYFLRSIQNDNAITIQNLITDLLPNCSDFRQSQSGLLVVEWCANRSLENTATAQIENIPTMVLSKRAFDKIHNYLYGSIDGKVEQNWIFDSVEHAARSSKLLLKVMKEFDVPLFDYHVLNESTKMSRDQKKSQHAAPITVLTIKRRKLI